MENRPEREEKETGRIEAFSDGVYAIVITLLVFDIKVPGQAQAEAQGLWQALLDLWPNLLGFVASFFFLLVMWINHHRLFTVIRRSDNNLLILNGLLLMGVCLVPFPTALVAAYIQHEDRVIAVAIYNGCFFMVAIFFNVLWWYAAKDNRLFTASTDQSLVAHISRQYIFGPFLYLGALLLGLVSPILSLLCSLLLAVFFALPNKNVQQLMDQANQ